MIKYDISSKYSFSEIKELSNYLNKSLNGFFLGINYVESETFEALFSKELNDQEISILNSFVIDPIDPLLVQQKHQRIKGNELLVKYIDLIGARNLELSSNGVQVDMLQLANMMRDLELLLKNGALKTSIGLINSINSTGNNYSSILESLKNEIISFLMENNWL